MESLPTESLSSRSEDSYLLGGQSDGWIAGTSRMRNNFQAVHIEAIGFLFTRTNAATSTFTQEETSEKPKCRGTDLPEETDDHLSGSVYKRFSPAFLLLPSRRFLPDSDRRCNTNRTDYILSQRTDQTQPQSVVLEQAPGE